MYAYLVHGLIHTSASCAVEDSTRYAGSMQTLTLGEAILGAFDHTFDICGCVK